MILIGTCTCSFVGAAIAPGATSIYRVVGAQIMIGVGFGSVPLAYAIPSEVRWRAFPTDDRSCPASGDRWPNL